MLTVLWVIVVASVVAMAGTLVGRNAVFAGRNRVQLVRARLLAAGCARRAVAAVDARLRAATSLEMAAREWRVMQNLTASPLLSPGCDVRFEAAGTRLDINAASLEMLESLFGALELQQDAHALASAVVDWRDGDDDLTSQGAERAWYESVHRVAPRNGPLADIRELSRVRGFEHAAPSDTVLGTMSGRVSLATAPEAVLLAVPGFTREAAERVVGLRESGTPPSDLATVVALLSQSSQNALLARYFEAVQLTTADPDAWILRSRASAGFPATEVLLEWRIVRAGRRAVIVRTRSRL